MSQQIFKTVAMRLGVMLDALCVTPLAGDASARTYSRLTWEINGNCKTAVLMMFDPSDSQAAEASSADAENSAELPFVNIQKHLKQCKIPVPDLFDSNVSEGWLLLEDLGDLTLLEAIRSADEDTIERHYRRAIDILLCMHDRDESAHMASGCMAYRRAFDEALWMWEFDHFIEYGIEARLGHALTETAKKEIRAYFSEISFRLSRLPRVLTHRDYHSRNLMVQDENRLRVLDFQDALMAPRQYDLASLLRDSYTDLPEAMVERLIAYYCKGHSQSRGSTVSVAAFLDIFDLVSLHRNLKAAGRFIYLDRVKHNDKFLVSVPLTLSKARRTLQRSARLGQLYRLLSDFVPEWQ